MTALPKSIFAKIAFATPFVLTFAWGLVVYPDAPIRECNGQFVGKWGKLHTASEYRHFMIWQTWFITLWLSAFAWYLWTRLVQKAKNDI